MQYLTNVVVGIFSTPVFLIFLIAGVGYFFGSIRIKGISLGTAAVFLAALVFGHFGFADNSLLHTIGLITTPYETLKAAMSLTQGIGLICFVTAVGLIAGPKFFHNLKQNAKSYVFLSVIIIGLGSLTCVLITALTKVDAAMSVGLLSGALTTTPGFAAAQEAVVGNDYLLNEISVGHGIAYPFGVVGVVLFVQIVPKLLHVNMDEERMKINAGAEFNPKPQPQNLIEIDPFGFGAFALTVVVGVLLGKLSIPLPGGSSFSLGNTGGTLIMGLIVGHFGHMGRINLKVRTASLETFREFGLMLFLIGAGVPGGSGFVAIIQEQGFILFIYGALMTLLPMVGGYLFARYVLKLGLLNNLGSITGGMTSTPALGALINVAQTDDVASAYAATYPCALVLVVLASQFIVTLM
ncbi:MAG: permease [Oscillibacter sp.]|jgi:putative transport protein|nr:permease [Oscillibacter sp.]